MIYRWSDWVVASSHNYVSHCSSSKKPPLFLENSSFFRILNKNPSKWTYLHPASKQLKGMPDRSHGETLLNSKVLSVKLVFYDIARPLLNISCAGQVQLSVMTLYKRATALKRTQTMQQNLFSQPSVPSTQVSSSTLVALQTETSLSWKHWTNTSVIYRMTFSQQPLREPNTTSHTHTLTTITSKPSPQRPLQCLNFIIFQLSCKSY